MKTKEEYEQMELDTRPDLERAIVALAADAVQTAEALIERHNRLVAQRDQTAPPFVRNRHEAYGIAAEQLAKIQGAVKAIKGDTDTLLGTLSNPNYPAVEATSSIVNSTNASAATIIWAAAAMKKTLDNLYISETEGPSPMELLAQGSDPDGFQEAEPVEADADNEQEE